MRKILAMCAALAGGAAWMIGADQCLAASPALREVAPPPSVFLSKTRALRQFLGQDTVTLRGDRGEAGLSIPLTGRVRLTSARLKVVFVNSPALTPGRSQLVVLLNDHVVGVAHLHGDRPRGVMRVDIPVEYFRAGFNRLEFRASQHYGGSGCENPGSPELWTQIDAAASRIELRFHNARIHPSLDRLPALMDERIWDRYDIQFLSVKGAAMTGERLQAGALLAQGVGLHTRYLPVRIHHARASRLAREHRDWKHPRLGVPQRGMDAILFGTYDELRPLLGEGFARGGGSEWLGIERMDGDRTRFLLVVAGADEAALKRAARAFANLALAGKAEASGWRTGKRGVERTFASLGFATWSMQGMSGVRRLRFWVAPDQLASPEADMELELHASYGAGLRRDSALDVLVNGRFQQAVALDRPEGQQYWHYRIKIPMRALRAGENVVEFRASLTPLVTGRCMLVRTEQLRLTLYDDSRVHLPVPRGAGRVRRPDLTYLSGAGYPFDRGGTCLLATRSDAAAGAAWSLLARIAQAARRIVDCAFVERVGDPDAARPLLVIGARDDIGPAWWRGTALDAAATARPDLDAARLAIRSRRANLLLQHVREGRLVTILSVADAGHLESAVWRLVDYPIWGALKGDAWMWPTTSDADVRSVGRGLHLILSARGGEGDRP